MSGIRCRTKRRGATSRWIPVTKRWSVVVSASRFNGVFVGN